MISTCFPDGSSRWGLAYMINTEPGPDGRSAGSLSWGGIFNSYYWIDPPRRVAAVILTQILPFADPAPSPSRRLRARRVRGAEPEPERVRR